MPPSGLRPLGVPNGRQLVPLGWDSKKPAGAKASGRCPAVPGVWAWRSAGRLLRLVVEAGRGLRREAAALERERLAAGELPVAGGGAPRERLPAVAPIAQTIAVPGRLHVERIEVELLPQRAGVLHVLPRRQRQRRHRILAGGVDQHAG